ncbi:TetR/AcrR family transcriptional regulator [Streptacidiphilus melanogenes]|uniref:TetR/AcrR family transcriptional regulator n=1 Tax=Streptacidiphilus melanogenes TaxID=411235 RepID=UPI000694BD00|nr:TetR/AcrR family transcriptional regulator [Streptacidiphilus melanogenes]
MVKQARAWLTRDRVLDAAAQEFAIHGYEPTKLHDVIARTGMTKGALYAHFGSKHQLASALVDESTAHWNRIRAAPTAPPPSAEAALTELIRRLGAEFDTNIRFRAALRLVSDSEWPLDDPDGLFRGIHRELVTRIRGAQEEKELTAAHPPESLAYLILAILYGAAHMQAAWGTPMGDRIGLDHAWRVLCTILGL